MPDSASLAVHPGVRRALDAGRPVVALESTVLAHGLPWPDNLALGRRLEEVVRAGGATPATIAVLRGRLRVGLEPDELERVARGHDLPKLSRRDLPAAIARYDEAVAAGAPPETRLDRARALLAAGWRERALPDLDAVAACAAGPATAQARRLLLGLRHPERERMLETAGRIALAGDASRFEEAHGLLAQLLAVADDLWEAHFALGLLARREGDAEGAERAFRAALVRHPEQPDALHELGVALLLRDQLTDALAALERAAALRPDDPGYLADAGYARLRAGDIPAARRHLERSRALAPDDEITGAYLAELARVEAEDRRAVGPS